MMNDVFIYMFEMKVIFHYSEFFLFDSQFKKHKQPPQKNTCIQIIHRTQKSIDTQKGLWSLTKPLIKGPADFLEMGMFAYFCFM